MKNLLYSIFVLIFISSCSSDNDSQDNLPQEEQAFTTREQDIKSTMWFFDKEVYTLINGEVVEVLPEPCTTESWFDISTNLLTFNYYQVDDGNGECVPDRFRQDSFFLYLIADGYFNIGFFTSPSIPTFWKEYEIILENNGIDAIPHPRNIMIWKDHNPDELFQGQPVSTKQLFFKRRR